VITLITTVDVHSSCLYAGVDGIYFALKDRQHIQPPLFNRIEEPLDADAKIHTIESMFSLLQVPCSEESKAHFVAQQLHGSARLWWDNCHGMLPADHIVTWKEFKNAFRSHHIPEGLMQRKLNEILALTQGTRTVL
jgi:hypothetical protein